VIYIRRYTVNIVRRSILTWKIIFSNEVYSKSIILLFCIIDELFWSFITHLKLNLSLVFENFYDTLAIKSIDNDISDHRTGDICKEIMLTNTLMKNSSLWSTIMKGLRKYKGLYVGGS